MNDAKVEIAVLKLMAHTHHCVEEITPEIDIARQSAADHDWCDALNHFVQAVQIAEKYYPNPQDYDNEVDTLLSRCVGYIGGQIVDAIGGQQKQSFLEFKLTEQGEKTSKWDVLSKRHGFVLGTIKWYGAWRQYTFFPTKETLYNKDCMREIASFLEDQMKARKSGRNQ